MQEEEQRSTKRDLSGDEDNATDQLNQLRGRLSHVENLNAGLIHEFNNSIGIISGFAELAKLEPGLTEPVQQALDQILTVSWHGRQLVRDAGNALHQRPVVARDINIPVLLDEVSKLLAPDIPDAVTVEWRWDEAPATFSADAAHLRQILFNLMHNAIRSIDGKGTITVVARDLTLDAATKVSGELTIEPGNYLLMSVEDDGCGITSEWQEKVLLPFVTTHNEDGGTGMGLAVVASLAARYNGGVKLDSVAGEGTWVRVYLKTQ